MPNVKVVTAYVPLPVHHLTREQYIGYGNRLADACKGRIRVFMDYPFEQCWVNHWGKHVGIDVCGLKPATPTPGDRYSSPEVHTMSNIVQHQRTTWARMAALEDPYIDTWVWLDFGILKQGYWNDRPLIERHVTEFLDRLEDIQLDHIPFPGIEDQKEIDPTGNCWRFCGSTHIWPSRFLKEIDIRYKAETMSFTITHGTMPLDLPIWSEVEWHSGLPFRQYRAEYDYTQLTNFPG